MNQDDPISRACLRVGPAYFDARSGVVDVTALGEHLSDRFDGRRLASREVYFLTAVAYAVWFAQKYGDSPPLRLLRVRRPIRRPYPLVEEMRDERPVVPVLDRPRQRG